jgi:hypothetical protein
MAYTTIDKSSLHMNTKLYQGNGTTLTIPGIGFQPDAVWIKARGNAGNHINVDAVRGSTKYVQTNSTAAEVTDATGVSSFNADGFALGSNGNVNDNAIDFVAWNWKANGAGVANAVGDISSTVSANTTAGFSIVKYTGTGTGNSTIGHGLGVVPKFIIVKNLSTVQAWGTKSDSYVSPADPGVLYLNTTAARAADTNVWGTSAAFTSTTFTVGDWAGSNELGSEFIAYLWNDVRGFSQFGSYEGSGNANGNLINLGFKPAFVMVKSTGSGGWLINDTKRSPHNITGSTLYADSSASEESYTIGASEWDFLSNGFKNRNAGSSQNTSGTSYIYMAFAEAPLVSSTNVPCTAR